jgi:hypothetical protein
MKLVNLIQEDFTNYKKPSLFLGFPKCSGKCNKIAGKIVCQNEELRNAEKVEISADEVVKLYISNDITKALVCGGLEPLDSSEDLLEIIEAFRKVTNDDIVIYTGYTETEVKNSYIYGKLLQYPNIIMKYGRYLINQQKHFDELLGVYLASNNQYARPIS